MFILTEEKRAKMLQAKTTKEFYEAAGPLETMMPVMEFGEDCVNHLCELYKNEKKDVYADDPPEAFRKRENDE